MLGWIGYDGGAAVQSAGAIKGLVSMNLLAPAVGGLCSFLSFKFIWNINSDVRAKITDWKMIIYLYKISDGDFRRKFFDYYQISQIAENSV